MAGMRAVIAYTRLKTGYSSPYKGTLASSYNFYSPRCAMLLSIDDRQLIRPGLSATPELTYTIGLEVKP